MQTLYVIIVTYNGMQWYDKCFSSLRESSYPLHVIVVDNSPKDDLEYFRKHFPEVIVIQPKQNLGFGKANNLAIKYALNHGADYVFLLNQDTWLIDKDIFAKLILISQNHKEYGILSPLHMKNDEKTLGMMLEHQSNKTSTSILSDVLNGNMKDVYPTNYVNAAAWLLPRRTLEIVGGFDPIYQHYEEDDDYLNRVHYHGFKIGICPSTRIVHDHQNLINPFNETNIRYRHEQLLLVNLMNINKSNIIGAQIRYFLRKLFIYLFTAEWSGFQTILKDLLYVMSMYRIILNSRSQNMKQEASWL